MGSWMIEWYCTRRIGMKKTFKLTVLASLLLTLFGCSSPVPAKEVKEASVLYDNVQITYPEGSDYTYENVSADWFSFFSKEKGTEININRTLKDDVLNADNFMKSSFPEDKLIEEDGVVYAEYQDGLLRVLENTYYLYVIYRLPFKAETTDEAKAEIDQIFKKMAIDPEALVDRPQLPDDGFMYEKMVIHTPASMASTATNQTRKISQPMAMMKKDWQRRSIRTMNQKISSTASSISPMTRNPRPATNTTISTP